MEWKECTAIEFCSKVTDGTHDSPKPQSEGHYLITSKHIGKGKIDFSSANIISEEDYQKVIKRSAVEQFDILFSMIGTIGNIYRETSYNVDYAVKNMGIFKFDGDELKSLWMYYWLQSPKAKQYIYERLAGSTQSYLTLDSLRNFAVSYPADIDKMRRIASILSSLDRKIELNNKINAQLEEMAQAIFKNWFVDFEPFKDGKFVESELGMIPEGWRVGKLGEVADINPKRILKKGEEATYLDMKNMPTSGPFPHLWEKKVMNGGMKFKNGDTLMARITPCLENGKVAYVNFLNNNEVGFGSTEYIVMTSKNGVLPEVLYALCRYPDFVAYATSNMNGSSGRQRVSGEVIGNYQIVIPPTSVVEKLQPLFSSIMEQIKVHGFESLHLSQLRDTLLPRLMSGEIDLDEIEKTI